MEIVCDTNVWYKLGNGELSIEAFNNHDLIATGMTIDELGSTNNLLEFDRAIKVRDAFIAISNHASVEMDRLTNFILSKSGNQVYRSDEKIKKAIIEGIKKFITKTDEEVKEIVKSSRNEIEPLINEWKQPYQEIKNRFNELLLEFRESFQNAIKSRVSDQDEMSLEKILLPALDIEIDSILIKKIYESIIISNPNILNLRIDWSKFELLINATVLFFNELKSSQLTPQPMLFKQNDLVYLMNLAYVTNERKYCTCDNSGVYKVIKQSPITASFFYEINCKS